MSVLSSASEPVPGGDFAWGAANLMSSQKAGGPGPVPGGWTRLRSGPS